MHKQSRYVGARSFIRRTVTSSLYTNAVYMMMSHGILALLGFFFWVIVARYYTAAELGYSSAIISAIGLVGLIGRLGLDSFLVRFLSGSTNPARIMNTALTYSGIATALVALATAVGLRLWTPNLGFVATQPIFLAAFVAFAVASSLSTVAGAGFIAGRQAKYLMLKDALFGATKLFLPFLFLQRFHAFGIVASWGLATTLGLLAGLFLFMPRVLADYTLRPSLGDRLVRRAWGFSGMSYMVNLLAAAPAFIVPIIVIGALGPEENAYFYVSWAIATIVFFVPHSLAQSLLAEGAYDRHRLRHDVRRTIVSSFTLLLPVTILVWLFGERLLLAFGASYSERSFEVLRVLMLASLPLSVTRPFFSVLRVRGHLSELLVWRITLTSVLLGISYMLLPAYGLEVIGWIWLTVNSIFALATIVLRGRLWLWV